MSFVSTFPANFPKYLPPFNYDFAIGVERCNRIMYVTYNAIGTDTSSVLHYSLDSSGGSDVSLIKLYPQDTAKLIEVDNKGMSIIDVFNLSESIVLSRPLVDSSRGAEVGSDLPSDKYLDLLRDKVTTSPTTNSVYLGEGGIGGCVSADYTTLCYKKIGDRLDYETLLNILKALKEIDDTIELLVEFVKYILNIQQ